MMFSAAFTDDVKRCIEHVHQLYPHAPLFAIGFSLGANLLTKHLGEIKDQTPLMAAVCIANPFDFHIASVLMKTGFRRWTYTKRMVTELLKYVAR